MLALSKALSRSWRRRQRATRRRSTLADLIRLKLNGLQVLFQRELGFSWPHEVHILVPRAEFIKTYQNGRLVEERTVLSSISIVHAPLHPPAEGDGPPAPPAVPPGVAPHQRERRQETAAGKEKT